MGTVTTRSGVRPARSKKQALVYPWNMIPDWAIRALSGILLLPFLPLFVVCITLAMSGQGTLHLINLALLGLPAMVWRRAGDVVTAMGRPFVRDQRYASRFFPTVFLAVWCPACFALLMWRHWTYGFEWWMVPVYHLMRIGPRYRFFAYMYVLSHQEGHCYKGFFHGPAAILNRANEWWSGFFFGMVPNSFRVGHNKIHHRHDNLPEDTISTIDLDRSKGGAFWLYYPRFALYWSGVSSLAYFAARGEWRLFREMLSGMVALALVWTASFWLFGFNFTLWYIVYAHVEGSTFFGGINYVWHHAADENSPHNPYINSVTILSGHDNIWNEDFHVEHHHWANLHPSEYAEHFAMNQGDFQANEATIYRDCEEGTLLYWVLAEKHDEMAKHFVDLSGKLSHDDKKALIVHRLRSRIVDSNLDDLQLARERKQHIL